jgi:hypothetical protein
MKISTVIPVYLASKEKLLELELTLISLDNQTQKPDEVIISSNTTDLNLHNQMIDMLKHHSLNVFVIRNTLGMSAQANTNNGVAQAKNEIIHILHHDDPIVEDFAYEKISRTFKKGNTKWAIFNVVEKDTISLPKIQRGLIWGFNSIGGPSVLITLKELYIPFSTNYSYLWDCVNFHDYIMKYGKPLFFNDLHIATGSGNTRLSGTVNEKTKLRDFQMLRSLRYITTKGLLFLILLPRYWNVDLKFILNYIAKDKSWLFPIRFFALFFSFFVLMPAVWVKSFCKKIL